MTGEPAYPPTRLNHAACQTCSRLGTGVTSPVTNRKTHDWAGARISTSYPGTVKNRRNFGPSNRRVAQIPAAESSIDPPVGGRQPPLHALRAAFAKFCMPIVLCRRVTHGPTPPTHRPLIPDVCLRLVLRTPHSIASLAWDIAHWWLRTLNSVMLQSLSLIMQLFQDTTLQWVSPRANKLSFISSNSWQALAKFGQNRSLVPAMVD
jgi:hypothetical protein